jgi:hypothetical protein
MTVVGNEQLSSVVLVETDESKVEISFSNGDLWLIVILVFVDRLQHLFMNSFELLLVSREDVGDEDPVNGLVVAHSQLHHAFVCDLFYSRTFPQDSITPSWCSIFFAAVPVVSAWIILVGGPKSDFAFLEVSEDAFVLNSLDVELVQVEDFVVVTERSDPFIVSLGETIIQVANPKYLIVFHNRPRPESIIERHSSENLIMIFVPLLKFLNMSREMRVYETHHRLIYLKADTDTAFVAKLQRPRSDDLSGAFED